MNIQIDTTKKIVTLLEPINAGELFDKLAEFAKRDAMDYEISFPTYAGTEIKGKLVEYKPEDFYSTC